MSNTSLSVIFYIVLACAAAGAILSSGMLLFVGLGLAWFLAGVAVARRVRGNRPA